MPSHHTPSPLSDMHAFFKDCSAAQDKDSKKESADAGEDLSMETRRPALLTAQVYMDTRYARYRMQALYSTVQYMVHKLSAVDGRPVWKLVSRYWAS